MHLSPNAKLGETSAREAVHAAVLAEEARARLATPRVLTEIALAGEQPERRRVTMLVTFGIFVQTLQLQRETGAPRSTSTSKRTLPQWQAPVYVFAAGEVEPGSSFVCFIVASLRFCEVERDRTSPGRQLFVR